FSQLIILCPRHLAATSVGRQVMGFVEDDQIPERSLFESLHSVTDLERVDTGNKSVVLGKGVRLPVEHVTLTAEDLEVEVKDFVQFAVPVIHQSCGNNHESTVEFPSAGEFSQQQSG